MARMASNSQQPYSRGYEPSYETVTAKIELTFAQAVAQVVVGLMNPLELFVQLPKDLQVAVEGINSSLQRPQSNNNGIVKTAETFAQLTRERQVLVLQKLLEELNQPEKPTEMTFSQAVERVLSDQMNSEDLVVQLPEELQTAVQHFSQVLLDMEKASSSGTTVAGERTPFAKLTTDRQKFVLQSLADALTKQSSESARPVAG